MKEPHIAVDPGSGEAYLAHSNVSVWALDYYHQHLAVIDARILLNRLPSTTVFF
jgi:hypothetical protein